LSIEFLLHEISTLLQQVVSKNQQTSHSARFSVLFHVQVYFGFFTKNLILHHMKRAQGNALCMKIFKHARALKERQKLLTPF